MTYKIKDLALLTIDRAAGKARTLLERAKKKLGFVPNMYGAMANEPALFETYDSGYDAFRAECGFTPVEQEAIFLSSAARTAAIIAWPRIVSSPT
jgi:hypothetical protein